MHFLGIDVGASYIKGAVLNLAEMRLEAVRRTPFPGFIAGKPAAYREVDPNEIIDRTRGLVDSFRASASECGGIVFSGQMHGLITVDSTGKALSNFISWQDERGLTPHPSARGTYFELVASKVSAPERRLLGNELRPNLPLVTLFWLSRNKQLSRRTAYPCSLMDFIVANLSRSRPVTEASNGAATGALNVASRCWDYELIARLQLGGLCWPAIRDFRTVAGCTRLHGKEVPCYVPVGDQQAAIVGACLQPEELSINIATGSQVSCLAATFESGDHQTRPFFDGTFLKTITHIPAGRALNSIVSLLRELDGQRSLDANESWAYIESAVHKVPSTDLKINLAFFSGSCGSRGEIRNIHEGNLTVGHLFRACFEHMAEMYYECAERIRPPEDWRVLVLSGGLAWKSPALRDQIHSRFRLPFRVPRVEEDALFGLLILAKTIVQPGRKVLEVARATRKEDVALAGQHA